MFPLAHRKADHLQFPPRKLDAVIEFVKTHPFFHKFHYESTGQKIITVNVKPGAKSSTTGLPGSAHCSAHGLDTIKAKVTAFFNLHLKTVYDELQLGQAIRNAKCLINCY